MGWSDAELGRQFDIRGSSVNGLLRGGSHFPSAKTLLLMRDAGWNIDYIMRARGDPLIGPAETGAMIELFHALNEDNRRSLASIGETMRKSQRPRAEQEAQENAARTADREL